MKWSSAATALSGDMHVARGKRMPRVLVARSARPQLRPPKMSGDFADPAGFAGVTAGAG
jgi:hypothetical protein